MTKKTTKNQTYNATFTLTQDGLEGEVKAKLTLEPEINFEEFEDIESLPFVFRAMTELAHLYLMGNGIMDREGNLLVNTIDEGEHLRVVEDKQSGKGKAH